MFIIAADAKLRYRVDTLSHPAHPVRWAATYRMTTWQQPVMQYSPGAHGA
jgi:hypothetical protein